MTSGHRDLRHRTAPNQGHQGPRLAGPGAWHARWPDGRLYVIKVATLSREHRYIVPGGLPARQVVPLALCSATHGCRDVTGEETGGGNWRRFPSAFHPGG